MAKRKGKTQPRKRKKKKETSFLSSVKRFFLSVVAVFVCFVGLLFLYNYFYPGGQENSGRKAVVREKTSPSTGAVSTPKTSSRKKTSPNPADKQARKTSSAQDTRTQPASSRTKGAATAASSAGFPSQAEMPRLLVKRTEQVIRHEGYTVSYNSDYRIANWVAYELTGKEAKSKKNERSNKFVPDPMVKGATARNEDYTRTGYDRGHLAPAGDMKWSAKAMRESFYLSNICPQKPGLNRGIWKELEEQSRLWAMDNGALLIATGPVMTPEMRRMGKNRVGVPETFYKVLCMRVGNEYKTIGFLLDNKDYGKTLLQSIAIPVDSVEKVTGIDFFSFLPDAVEKKVEACVDRSAWSF